MTTPTITVIIPAFNSEKTIRRALDSVAAQTFSDFEIIVIDDDSKDQTLGLVSHSSGAELRVIQHAQNLGAAAARNSGIAAARGRWIAFLDSDDEWLPDKLERQLAALKNAGRQNIMACATGYRLYKNGRELAVKLKLTSQQFRNDILFGCTISPGSTLLVDRRAFDEIGLFDDRLRRLEDWDWLLRYSERPDFDILFVPELLANVYTTKRALRISELDPALNAIDRIRHIHLHRLKGVAKIKLRNALLIETAARMFQADRPFSAIMYVIAATLIYPFRNAAFFRSLWRSFRSLFSS